MSEMILTDAQTRWADEARRYEFRIEQLHAELELAEARVPTAKTIYEAAASGLSSGQPLN